MSVAASVYDKMPVRIQHMLISAQGYVNRRTRYGTEYREYSRLLSETEQWPLERLREYQLTHIRAILHLALTDSAYYRKQLGECLGVVPDAVSWEDFSRLPFLDKDTLRGRMEEITCPSQLRHGFIKGHTSGTSGKPISYFYDHRSMQRNYAFRDRQYRWAGVMYSDRSCRFSGRNVLGRHIGPPFYRSNRAERQFFFSSYHLSEENLSDYCKELAALDPVYIDGYPSAITTVARYLVNHKSCGEIRPRAVMTTAEPLLEHQREIIRTAFGCPVFNFYSSSEGAPFIVECPLGRPHMCLDSGVFEVLDRNGHACRPGEVGELVVTGFFQRSFPLIRYRIGDRLALSNTACPCGCSFPCVDSVEGRCDDVVVTSQRGEVGRLDPVFKGMKNCIGEAQIAQVAKDEFELRYVPDGGVFVPGDLDSVVRECHRKLGDNVKIKTVEMTRIPRGASGKFKAVVNELDARRKDV